MNCREFQDLLVILICGSLTEKEQEDFNSHLATCPACSRIHEQIPCSIQEDAEKPPTPDWNASWTVIAEKSLKAQHKSVRIQKRWVLAVPALATVFMLGLVAGKWILRDRQSTILPFDPTMPMEAHVESLIGNLQMILTDAKNTRRDIDALSEFHFKVVQDLLAQTRFLIAISNYRKEAQLVESLKDVESMLISISNLRPEDRDAADQMVQILRDWTAQKRWILPEEAKM